MITAAFCSQLPILERRNFAPPERNFVSSKRYFVSAKRNFVRPARNFPTKFRLMPRNFFSIHHIVCENFADIRIIEVPKFRRIFVWNESSKFDCRNSRNFDDFCKFRLHFVCTVLYQMLNNSPSLPYFQCCSSKILAWSPIATNFEKGEGGVWNART